MRSFTPGDTVKLFKDPRKLVVRDAASIILDGDIDPVVRAVKIDIDLSSIAVVLYGVGKEVC